MLTPDFFYTFDIRASALDNQFVYILDGIEAGIADGLTFLRKMLRDHRFWITGLHERKPGPNRVKK